MIPFSPEELNELAAGYVLGDLTSEESALFQQQLQQDDALQQRVDQLQETLGMMALGVPSRETPPELRSRIMLAAEGTPENTPENTPESKPDKTPENRPSHVPVSPAAQPSFSWSSLGRERRWLWLSSGAALLVGILLSQQYQLKQQVAMLQTAFSQHETRYEADAATGARSMSTADAASGHDSTSGHDSVSGHNPASGHDSVSGHDPAFGHDALSRAETDPSTPIDADTIPLETTLTMEAPAALVAEQWPGLQHLSQDHQQLSSGSPQTSPLMPRENPHALDSEVTPEHLTPSPTMLRLVEQSGDRKAQFVTVTPCQMGQTEGLRMTYLLDQKTAVSVYKLQRGKEFPHPGAEAMSLQSAEGLSMILWEEDRSLYAIVSDLPMIRLKQLAIAS